MKSTFPGGRTAVVLAVAGIATLGAAHVLWRTSTHGAQIGNDSVWYLVTSQFLIEGVWLDFTQRPLLFPLALAFTDLVSGIDPVEAARLMNAAAFGATILLLGLWVWRRLRSGFLAISAAVLVAFSVPLAEAASTLLTEAIFILLLLLALTQLDSFLADGAERRKRRLAAAAAAAALTALTRYAGVSVILTGVLALLLDRRRRMADRMRNAAVFGAVSSTPLAALLARNWAETGAATGKRLNSGYSLADSLSQIDKVLSAWTLLPVADDGALTAAVVGALAALLAAAVWAPRRAREGDPMFVCFIFIFIYPVFLVAAVPMTVLSQIDTRYLAPVYPCLVLAAAFIVHRIAAARAAGALRRVLAIAAIAVLGAHTGLSARANFGITRNALERGYGYGVKAYNTPYWDDFSSRALMWSDNPVFANKPAVLAAGFYRIYTGEGFRRAPEAWKRSGLSFLRRRGGLSLPEGGLDDFLQWFEGVPEGARIVWYGEFDSSGVFGYDFHDLLCVPGLRTVLRAEDAVVFRVDRGHAPDCRPDLPPGAPIVRGVFDVRLDSGVLVYSRIPCARTDTRLRFFLHVVPARFDSLPEGRREFGFANLDFFFDEYGSRLGDVCVARVALPEYPVAAIRTGQVDWPAEPEWSGEYEFPGGSRG